MPANFQLRLLGAFSIQRDGAPVAGFHAQRLQSLLAYLVLHREVALTRRQVVFLLWPDTSDKQAQTNLRQLLHTLYRRLPELEEALEDDGHTLRWRTSGSIAADVIAFEQTLADAAQRNGGARIDAFERAVAAYGGDLLPACYDDWLFAARERLVQQYTGALEQLIAANEELRAYPAAIDYSQRLLHHNPLRESAYRNLMRLHALAGDRAAALRIYHACAARLERELGVEPGASTRQVYERLLNATGMESQGPLPARPVAAERAVEISTARGYPYSRYLAATTLGWSLAMQGRVEEGAALARQTLDESMAVGQRLHHSQLAAMAAAAHLVAGQPHDALAVAEEAIAAFHDYHDLLCAPDLYLLRGRALAGLGADDAAVEHAYREGLALAQQLDARVSALRAAVSVAQFYLHAGRTPEARATLQEVYDGFDAGQSGADLDAARRLLEQMTGSRQ